MTCWEKESGNKFPHSKVSSPPSSYLLSNTLSTAAPVFVYNQVMTIKWLANRHRMRHLQAPSLVDVAGKRFRVGRHGVAVLAFIKQLLLEVSRVYSVAWMLANRDRIRESQ